MYRVHRDVNYLVGGYKFHSWPNSGDSKNQTGWLWVGVEIVEELAQKTRDELRMDK